VFNILKLTIKQSLIAKTLVDIYNEDEISYKNDASYLSFSNDVKFMHNFLETVQNQIQRFVSMLEFDKTQFDKIRLNIILKDMINILERDDINNCSKMLNYLLTEFQSASNKIGEYMKESLEIA
jgi:hypothetical protein